MMCIFHEYKKVTSEMGTTNSYSLFGGHGREKVTLVLEKCSKCGKERAYMLDSDNHGHSMAVWIAKEHLGVA